MSLTDELRTEIEAIITKRFFDKVRYIEMEQSMDFDGDEVLVIHVYMDKDTTADDFAGKFFGLTDLVIDAMDEEMPGIFPVIRPTEADERHGHTR